MTNFVAFQCKNFLTSSIILACKGNYELFLQCIWYTSFKREKSIINDKHIGEGVTKKMGEILKDWSGGDRCLKEVKKIPS